MCPKPNYSVRTELTFRPLVKRLVKQLNVDPQFRDSVLDLLDGKSAQKRLDALSQEMVQLRAAIEAILSGVSSRTERPVDKARVLEAPQLLLPGHPPSRQAQVGEKLKSEARKTADWLVVNTKMTRAQIEQELQKRHGIDRDRAQAIASRAVNMLDPGNPARRTHKVPIARRVTRWTKRKMRALVKKGWQKNEVAQKLGCDPRTVQEHTRGLKAVRRRKNEAERGQQTGPLVQVIFNTKA
jgi:DNA-binding NarL/FixJ family response regulator